MGGAVPVSEAAVRPATPDHQAAPSRTVPGAEAPGVTPAGRAPVVMIIGDSFTVGSGPVTRWQSYAAQAARELDWQLITAGAGGTGFVNPGRVDRTFEDSFADELAWRPAPDLLIVSGGHNDRGTPPGEVHEAAARLLDMARGHWPPPGSW
nr:hypothetical protein GCM10020093_085950 [Planobispora longispora]